MRRVAAAMTAALGVAIASAAASAPAGAVAWTELPALAAAAKAAAGDDSETSVRGDTGLGCFTSRIAVGARGARPEAVIRGFITSLTDTGGDAEPTEGDDGVRFVLGRYQGEARLAVTDDRVEMVACMCWKDRYPMEDACASVWR